MKKSEKWHEAEKMGEREGEKEKEKKIREDCAARQFC